MIQHYIYSMDLKMLGQQIKAARLEEGLTQEELAARVFTNKANISRTERGNQNVSFLLLQRIAEALNRNINDEILIKK